MGKRRKRKVYSGIKAKPTKYLGVQFKSKLEARWAVFLESHFLVNDWRYEPKTYTLREGKWEYTPDFYVNAGGRELFLEIKPTEPTPEYLSVLMQFAHHALVHPLVICVGDMYKGRPVPTLHFTRTAEACKLTECVHFADCEEALSRARNFRFDLRSTETPGPRDASELQAHIQHWVAEQRRKSSDRRKRDSEQ